MNRLNRRRGFTLIELLVAITVLAIVAVLGWRGLDSIVRARTSLNADLDQTRGLQLAFAQMQSDCGRIADGDKIGGRSVLSVQAGRLTLVRTVFADNQPSRLQVVAYRIRDGALIRRESVATRNLAELDTAWSAALSDADMAPAVTLSSDVGLMAIRVYVDDGKGWRAAGESPVSPSPPQRATAPVTMAGPTGLEVALQLHNRPANLIKIFLLGAV